MLEVAPTEFVACTGAGELAVLLLLVLLGAGLPLGVALGRAVEGAIGRLA